MENRDRELFYDTFKAVEEAPTSRNESRLMNPLRINGRLETTWRYTRKLFPEDVTGNSNGILYNEIGLSLPSKGQTLSWRILIFTITAVLKWWFGKKFLNNLNERSFPVN